ncbi:hypothetical protein MKW98_024301 [Papaver atlanticum]|uniref:Uncharacterized protein n=1 Tax=Papaver atlanticum TaxID=357466 RepID=A0AAD4XLH3_9MAGN|nr:hypothetical protein MKW98_024301 [Papaver atlanticum]
MKKQVSTNEEFKRGAWKPEEDLILKRYIEANGEGKWTTVSKKSGLMRSAKSCRMRWKNHLRPNIKHGQISEDEEDLIIRMHKLLGNRWSLIAGRIPGRTDNEVKNYWNTHLSKRNLNHQGQSMNSVNFNCKKRRSMVSDTNDTQTISIVSTKQQDESNIFNGSDERVDAQLSNPSSTTSTSSGAEEVNAVQRYATSTTPDNSAAGDTLKIISEEEIYSCWLSDEPTFYVPFVPSLDYSILPFDSLDNNYEDCWTNKLRLHDLVED